jgi:CDP-2,3-bis-(O-geranylgeranyl)-sn-glycerol synthase
MDDLLLSVRLLLLLGVANSAPIAAKYLLGTRWSAPLDAGWRFVDGRPLLGASKTVRGFVAAVAGAAIAAELLGFSLGLGAWSACRDALSVSRRDSSAQRTTTGPTIRRRCCRRW